MKERIATQQTSHLSVLNMNERKEGCHANVKQRKRSPKEHLASFSAKKTKIEQNSPDHISMNQVNCHKMLNIG